MLLVGRNELFETGFEIVLLQKKEDDSWMTFRRLLPVEAVRVIAGASDDWSLGGRHPGDAHTEYRYHWFTKPEEWTITGWEPLIPTDYAPIEEARMPDQDSLFGKHAPSRGEPVSKKETWGRIRPEEHIRWKPGELFADLDERAVALSS